MIKMIMIEENARTKNHLIQGLQKEVFELRRLKTGGFDSYVSLS